MSPADWVDKYTRIAQEIKDKRIVFFAATETMIQMSERIWDRGELTSGAKIQYKEDYQVYTYAPPWPKKGSGRGKPNAQGKTKKIKGSYYKTYLTAKSAIGRGDLWFELTGDLRRSWFGGVRPLPRVVNGLVSVIDLSREQAEKADGLAEEKGKFFRLQDAEIEAHTKRVLDKYRALL